ncbi:hypothetical protein [Prosthecochloris vibrioformis]
MMQDPKTGKRILDPVERAKLGLQVIAMSPDDATAAIDRYVDGKGYDEEGVAFFKDQVVIQARIRDEGAKLLDTSGQILRLVAGAFVARMPKSGSNGDASGA